MEPKPEEVAPQTGAVCAEAQSWRAGKLFQEWEFISLDVVLGKGDGTRLRRVSDFPLRQEESSKWL